MASQKYGNTIYFVYDTTGTFLMDEDRKMNVRIPF